MQHYGCLSIVSSTPPGFLSIGKSLIRLLSSRIERGRKEKAGRGEERERLNHGGDMATTASGAASGTAYEEQRRKRVLENLKHLEVTIRLLCFSLFETVSRTPIAEAHPSMDPLPYPPLFCSSPPVRTGSSIDLSMLLRLVSCSSLQDLGISEMSKSLLQAARLQKQNKSKVTTNMPCWAVLGARAHNWEDRVFFFYNGLGESRRGFDLLWWFLQAVVRASPKVRKKFDTTDVRRSARAKATVSYKEDVSSLLFYWSLCY